MARKSGFGMPSEPGKKALLVSIISIAVSGSLNMWSFGSTYHLYTTYTLPSGGLYAMLPTTFLWEPETTIDYTGC